MRRTLLVAVAAAAVLGGSVAAHDLFLRLGSFFVPAHTKVSVRLLNGTFDKSDNVITRDRMLDVSVVGPATEVVHPEPSQWREFGKTTLLDFETGPPGTYSIGVSTAAKVLEMSAEDFNNYLAHDGVDDVLKTRERDGKLQASARERYSKHVKAIIQVGEARTAAFGARLGYPIEIVPRQNPYDLSVGDKLEVVVLRAGEPLEGQLVYASHEGFHGHDDSGAHIEAVKTRTDANGVATIDLSTHGHWYVRLIHMVEVQEPEVDYESNWATLTFELPAPAPQPGPQTATGFSVSFLLIGLAAVALLLFALRPRS